MWYIRHMATLDFNTDDMKAWQQALKRTPKALRLASAGVLNNQAFALRSFVMQSLERSMTIRNKGVLRRFTAVQKAKPGPISGQVAHVGSTTDANFTGWRENETGGRSDRAKIILLMARGGNPSKQVAKTDRWTQENVMTADKAGIHGSPGNRTIGLIAFLGRNGYKGVFELAGNQFSGGALYKIKPGQFTKRIGKGGRLRTIPRFYKVQEKGPHIAVKANPWMQRAQEELLQGASFRDEWMKALRWAMECAKG